MCLLEEGNSVQGPHKHCICYDQVVFHSTGVDFLRLQQPKHPCVYFLQNNELGGGGGVMVFNCTTSEYQHQCVYPPPTQETRYHVSRAGTTLVLPCTLSASGG